MPRVTFQNPNPSEKEFLEEFNKYNTSWWFLSIVIFRCFAPFSLALQTGIFELPGSIDTYLRQEKRDVTTDVNKVVKNCRKSVFLWTNVLKNIGVFVGAPLGGVLADVFGRRKIGLCFSTVATLSSALVMFVGNEQILILLHALSAASCTIVDTVTLITCAEISNTKHRFLVLYTISTSTIGSLVMDAFTRTVLVWKYQLLYVATANLITIFVCWYIPESPLWLLTHNLTTPAYQQLEEASGKNYTITGENKKMKTTELIQLIFRFFAKIRRRNFLLLSLSMFVAASSYHSARISELLRVNCEDEFGFIIIIGEILSYLLLFPVYGSLQKRCGLLFIFLLLILRSVIGLATHKIIETVYFNAFGILFGHTALCLNWLYFIEAFPTFVRGAAVGSSTAILAATAPIFLFAEEFLDRFLYLVVILISALLGACVVCVPETPLKALSNQKPY